MNKKQNPTLVALVAALADGDYHDGNTLGESLGMTRSAIWKAIKKLESYGVKINSDKRQGYQLVEPLSLLDEAKLKALLPAPFKLAVFETTTSTNDYLKSLRPQSAPQLCLAEHQTAGRGRLHREWVSPFGKNIYLSYSYLIEKDISELAGLSLVVSLAIYTAIRELGVDNKLQVKWPNDIYYTDKKLSGTLIEVQAESNGMSQVIIGIGLNVNMVAEEWTSLQSILGRHVDRHVVIIQLIKQLLSYLERFKQVGFVAFLDEWARVDCLQGKTVSLKNLETIVTGDVVGVNEHGHLLLKLADGRVQAFSSGEASLQ